MALKNKSQGRRNERVTMNRVETGVPEVIVCDNGSEFHSGEMKAACDRLGILVTHYTPTFQPRPKGGRAPVPHDQRVLAASAARRRSPWSRLQAEAQAQRTSGANRGFADRHRELRLRHSPYRWQKVLKARPIVIWRKDVAEHPIRRPSMLKDIDTIMLPGLETRHIGRRGVELNGSTYGTTEELHRSGSPMATKTRRSRSATIRRICRSFTFSTRRRSASSSSRTPMGNGWQIHPGGDRFSEERQRRSPRAGYATAAPAHGPGPALWEGSVKRGAAYG